MELADRIRILRKARGLSQQGLGDLLTTSMYGVSRQAVSEWETGNSVPKVENIKEIARVLDVSLEDLLDDSIDLEDKEIMLSVLHRDYKKSDDSLYKRFDITRSYRWAIILAIVFFTCAFSFLIFYVAKNKPPVSEETTIVGRLDYLLENTSNLYSCIFAVACGVPIAFSSVRC